MRLATAILVAGVASAGELRLVDVPPEPERAGPPWLTSFDEACALARKEKKPLFLYFTAKW